MKRLILLFGCFLYLSSAFATFRVIGYLPTWMNFPTSINSVDLAKVTHINIAFANPNSSGTLVPSGVTNAQVTTVVNACHAKSVKVFMSIGGSGPSPNNYGTLLSSTTNINNFVTKIVSYVTTYNLDGIDVDIEGDVLDGTTVTASQYQSFVTALGTALHAQGKEMSAALATWFASYVTNTAASKFDWINLMSYDECGPWSSPCQHSPMTLTQSDFSYWNTTKAVPATNLVIGVPFYGYGWGTYDTGDEIGYCDIVNTYSGAENTNQIGSGSNVIYYNGIDLIKQKAAYALANASGIMIWEIAEDCSTSDSRSLLLAINQVISPLPVTIENFICSSWSSFNLLEWSTSSEKDNDHFNIERSSDGKDFYVVGSIKGQGTRAGLTNYSYEDFNSLSGHNYYRLAQYDANGSVNYSNTIMIEDKSSKTYQVYPNPFQSSIFIAGSQKSQGNIRIESLQGDILLEDNYLNPEGILEIQTKLPVGVYVLKIIDSTGQYCYKIVKQ